MLPSQFGQKHLTTVEMVPQCEISFLRAKFW
jgi:hypothetical protein